MEILARAVGRRKEAVAQVQLVRGNGQFFINDKPAQVYLQNNSCSLLCIKAPLQTALSLSSPLTPPVGGGHTESLHTTDIPSLLPSPPPLSPPSGEVEVEGLLGFPPKGGIQKIEKKQNSVEQNPKELITTSLPTEQSESQNLANGKEEQFDALHEIDVIIKVKGGGLIGQAEAIKLGVARAFCIMENSYGGSVLRKILKTKGYLTQDSRVKERRKYGLKKARKASQYHKR